MRKVIVALIVALAAACLAATDVNKASVAELDGVKGIGPSLSGRILDERQKGNFRDWSDLISRVKGMGRKNAAKLSAEGLTVNEFAYQETAAAPAAGASGR